MDKTNKITITCDNWDERVSIAQKVASLMGINLLDIDDYVLRGSVMTGDIENLSKAEFIEKFGANTFDTLESISYMAYTDRVEEPFVISVGNDRNEWNAGPLRKTISIHISHEGESGLSSLLCDYSIPAQKSISSTAKKIAKIVASDERWTRNLHSN